MTRHLTKEQFWWSLIIAVLTIGLLVLAALQYRWSGEVSDATLMRMRQNLQFSLFSVRDELNREFTTLGRTLEPKNFLSSPDRFRSYEKQVLNWQRTNARPWIIQDIYVWKRSPVGWQIWKFESGNGQFVTVESVPSDLSLLQLFLDSLPHDSAPFPGRNTFGDRRRFFSGDRGPNIPWAIVDHVPALVHPITSNEQTRDREWIVILLNKSAIQSRLLPELAERFFGQEPSYEVSFLESDAGPLLYSTNKNATGAEPIDAGLFVFGPSGFGPGPRTDFGMRRADSSRSNSPPDRTRLMGLMRFDLSSENPGPAGWRVVVRHRDGSLEQAVHELRTKNILLSFGILLILTATTAVLLIYTYRAQRLANMQMTFVTGVSHELRTPLAVISSAAENIADGIVDNKQQLARYGNVIKAQAKQLIGLVEQILLFASSKDKRHQYQIRLLSVDEVIDAALHAASGLLHSERATVERISAPDLPAIQADLTALCHCLQNLIVNAIKYSGPEKWIGIHASANAGEVQIGVEDRGQGIPGSEISHIFEPFYRGRAATEAQIHGTGLGLPIARNIVEAFGGKITVTSEVGKGTTFTIHLPTAGQGAPVTDAALAHDEKLIEEGLKK